jgi:hypothetical protein
MNNDLIHEFVQSCHCTGETNDLRPCTNKGHYFKFVYCHPLLNLEFVVRFYIKNLISINSYGYVFRLNSFKICIGVIRIIKLIDPKQCN